MKSLLFGLAIASIFIIGCSEGESPTADIERFEYNTLCGWCVGISFLVIEGNEVTFTEEMQCTAQESITRELSLSEIDALQSALSAVDPNTIQLNECGECFDGCEEQLVFGESGNLHRIIFNSRDYPQLDELEELLEVVVEIKDSF